MSNRTDFFQSQQISPALPAAAVSIFVDGMLCPFLEPVEIVHSGWPQFSRARLRYNPAANTDGCVVPLEDIDTIFPMGKSLSIQAIYNGGAPGAMTFSYPIFEGQIDRIETKLKADKNLADIIAKDFSAILSRITVFGQRVVNVDGTTLLLDGFDTIFNPDSRPNASNSQVQVNGRSYTVFCPEGLSGRLWSYAELIDYLLSEYLPVGVLMTPELSRLRVLTDGQIARDLDVTGLSLLEALHRCCDRIALEFKFVPNMNSIGPRQAIVFYKTETGRTIELDCQKKGNLLNPSRTNIAGVSSRKNFWPVTHRYIGLGDFKIFEATFNLTMGWDSSLESGDFNTYCPSTNPDFYQVRDVFRKWTLNEAGDYSGPLYNRGQAFDFSKIFQSKNYVCHRRRFWPTLTTDNQGKSLGYYLQVTYDCGQSWWQYLDAFNILTDECGVWLSGERLGTELWDALLMGGLGFRITASIIGDERLRAEVADGPVNSVAPVIEHAIVLPKRFKYRNISSQSIFANSTDPKLGVPDRVDDSQALYQYVRSVAAASTEIIETIDIQTPYLALDYEVGDKVNTGPERPDLPVCKSDNRSQKQIVHVRMDFKNQCTNLRIIRKRRS
ncbi:MAG: hypothetical protein AMJ75_11285 [Phycisphaerae bacterium SM1_79]|nr:MAG: hypothetical protein AMJ75_11285 [Phycisphaerae bacterium SM1_79]